jgi:hypothetical protein
VAFLFAWVDSEHGHKHGYKHSFYIVYHDDMVPPGLLELLAFVGLIVGVGFSMILLAVGIGQHFTEIGETFL